MPERKFGDRLRDLMKEKGYSQAELARRTHISPQLISYYVNNQRLPGGHLLWDIAGELGVSVDYLLGNEGEDTDDPETTYRVTLQNISRNYTKWTPEQKAELVNTLFGADKEK